MDVALARSESDGPVTFGVVGAPYFVSIRGDSLQIAAGPEDEGTYAMQLTATDGVQSDAKNVTVVVAKASHAASPTFFGLVA